MTDTLPAAPLLTHVLERAEQLGWPATEVPPDATVDPGREAWEAWSASATRRHLARAIGVLVARAYRESLA